MDKDIVSVNELKEEGNLRFQSRDFAGALQLYTAGLHLLPRSHPDRAVFHSNCAACLMLIHPVNHEAVVAECSLTLQDVDTFLALEPAHADALDLARRLRSALNHPNHQRSRPLPAALGASATLGAPIPGLGPCVASLSRRW